MKALKGKLWLWCVAAVVMAGAVVVRSHCQIPCGIYDDPMRVQMIAEHITTIEKSMREIEQLSSADKPNMNQIVRWVSNKDAHADELSDIVTYYFMAQRLEPVDSAAGEEYDAYVGKLTLLHEMVYYSMKCKQTMDMANTAKLRELLEKFKVAYFGEAQAHIEAHGHEHN